MLKQCPFCGEKPITAINYSKCGGDELELTFSVFCPECHTSKSIRREVEGGDFEEYIMYMKEVITKWNTRVE